MPASKPPAVIAFPCPKHPDRELGTRRTWHTAEGTKRLRACAKCGHSVTTVEVAEGKTLRVGELSSRPV